ncbi:hypothetical protein R5W24_006474 [Gemmata sp. JC717]|uniref:hypothetical protein n=1 Tax=Gemmata algarum TaxID=2975278 RepID=UPI0021BA6B6A|nr:hypothetical protein [Gemmata algarum]MDY3557286.1 hypothetical protein [Gemmata algarum]
MSQREYPEFMLDNELAAASSERKRRLLSVAFCRRAWHLLTQKRSRRAVEVAERYADGEATTDELRAACAAAEQADHLDEGPIIWGGEVAGAALIAADRDPSPEDVAHIVAKGVGWSGALAAASDVSGTNHTFERAERAVLCELVRDVLGNPFRSVVFFPEWRTETVRDLAARMYESRDFGAMPILADALQDAGCDSDDILDHCRGDGPHVRGCWVVDLVLGKE